MYIIQTLNHSYIKQTYTLGALYGVGKNTWRAGGLSTDYPRVLVLEPIIAKLAFKWDGFQVLPIEDGIKAAFFRPDLQSFMACPQQEWNLSEDPVFYDPDFLRKNMQFWGGPLEIHLLIESEDVNIQEVKVGYEIPGNYRSTLQDYVLPDLLSKPIELTRTVLAQQPDRLEIPPNLNIDRFSPGSIYCYMNEPGVRIKGAIAEDRQFIQLERLIPNWVEGRHQPTRLVFNYQVPVSFVAGFEYQIQEVPSAIIRFIRTESRLSLYARDRVQIGQRAIDDGNLIGGAAVYGDQWDSANVIYHPPGTVDAPAVREVTVPSLVDLLLEATIYGYYREDAYAIGSAFISIIKSKGMLAAKGYGLECAIVTADSLTPMPKQESGFTSLEEVRLRIKLLRVPEATVDYIIN